MITHDEWQTGDTDLQAVETRRKVVTVDKLPRARVPDFFDTAHLHDDLTGHTIRGGVVTFAGQGASFALKLGSTAVLARLLTPADFGLIAMATAMTGFVEMFKDAGLSMATVQCVEINHRQISTLFWINLGLSLVLMLIVAAMAPGVAWFYGEPRLLAVTLALAILFPLSGLMIQHQALLRRQMKFGALVSIDIVSRSIGVAAGITAAAFGANYWAIVAMMGVTAFANAIMVWLGCRWVPGLPSRGAGVRPMLAFGGNLTGSGFVNYWGRNADNLLIGWYWGASPLGLYSRAYSLMLLPLTQIQAPIRAVVFPALSRLQENREEFAQFYLRAVNAMMWLCGPLVAFLAASSKPLILILLGDQWLGCVGIFRILAIIAFFQTIYTTIAWVFPALGRADRMLRLSLVTTPITVAAFAIGLPFGPTGVATAYAIAFLLLLPWRMQYTFRGTALTLASLIRAVKGPFCLSVLIFAALTGLLFLELPLRPLLQISVSLVLSIAMLLLSLMLVPALRVEASGIVALARRVAPSRS
jgi:O-antigen/teichoic acid export membrane protein